jgi:hypothetical protein
MQMLSSLKLRKLYLILLIGLTSVIATGTPSALIASELIVRKESVVYITKTGAKYHTSSCRYLRQSKIKISLKDAKSSGYTACKVCRP